MCFRSLIDIVYPRVVGLVQFGFSSILCQLFGTFSITHAQYHNLAPKC